MEAAFGVRDGGLSLLVIVSSCASSRLHRGLEALAPYLVIEVPPTILILVNDFETSVSGLLVADCSVGILGHCLSV